MPPEIAAKVEAVEQGAEQDAAEDLVAKDQEAQQINDENAAGDAEQDAAVTQRPAIVEIEAPFALDASGAGVPTQLSVTGDELTLSVSHEGTSVQYPVVADPMITITEPYITWQWRPVYRVETRVVAYYDYFRDIGAANGAAAIDHHPHYSLGNGWWKVDYGNSNNRFHSRWIVVQNKLVSRVLIMMQKPIYGHAWVIDHYEPYQVIEYRTRQEYQPSLVEYGNDQHQTDAAYDATDSGDVPDEPCTIDPEVADDCTSSDLANPAVQEALDAPSLVSGQESVLDDGVSAARVTGKDWGTADQQYWMFDKRDFQNLHTKRVRVIVPYNVFNPEDSYANEVRRDFKAWMRRAKAHKQEVVVSFGHRASSENYLPPPTEYAAEMRRFRREVDDQLNWKVRKFTAWNEPNNPDQPPSVRQNGRAAAKRAGQYWRELNAQCRGGKDCVVAAGDFADNGAFTDDYFTRYKHGMGRSSSAKVWAFHLHREALRPGNDGALNRFLKSTPASTKVWITEVGVRVWLPDDNGVMRRRSAVEVRKSMDWLTGGLITRTRSGEAARRIDFFYYYQYSGDENWDSGLIDFRDGSRRSLYTSYRNKIN